jgi:dihydroorotase
VERKPLARPGDWSSHPEVRDAETALRSSKRLIGMARAAGKRIHILHTTTADEIELFALNKDIVTCEITPQHLTLAAPECYERLKGLAQMNPPIRDARHQRGLWRGIELGIADVIGTDHSPHTLEEKARPYPASPSGMPGVQTLVAIMLTHVAEGRLSLERFVDLTSHGAGRVFGMAGKGRMAVGYDADLTVVDLNARRVIKNEAQVNRSGWTAFDGFKAKGWPMATIIRGRIVMRDDEVVAEGAGRPVRFLETLEAQA